MSRDHADSITIHSRRRGIAAATLAPLMLGLVSILAMILTDRVAVVPVILLVVAVGLGSIVVFDYPLRSVFSVHGIERRCLLRRHTIDWDDVIAIRRARGSTLSRGKGGLTAATGPRRHYLLVSHAESRLEYDELAARLDDWVPGLSIAASPPPESVTPTWLYRRRSPTPPS